MKLGEVSVSYVDIMAKTLKTLGFDPDPILGAFNITPVTRASADARISIGKFMRLGHRCIEVTGYPHFGLLMSQQLRISDLGYAGMLAMTSSTLQQAFETLTRYELLHTENIRGQSVFLAPTATHNHHGIARFYSLKPYNAYNYFVVDYVLSGWYQLSRFITNKQNGIEAVSFEFPAPEYSNEYSKFFDCEVQFNQPHNDLLIARDALKWPGQFHSASTHAMLKRQVDSELEKVRMGLSTHERVSRVIAPLLQSQTPTLEQVAEQLNIPPWTLRRQLVAEGGSFQHSLNISRRDLAINYLKDTAFPLGEIAYLLGFASSSAFQRAFKRWTGAAPGQFRAGLSPQHISGDTGK